MKQPQIQTRLVARLIAQIARLRDRKPRVLNKPKRNVPERLEESAPALSDAAAKPEPSAITSVKRAPTAEEILQRRQKKELEDASRFERFQRTLAKIASWPQASGPVDALKRLRSEREVREFGPAKNPAELIDISVWLLKNDPFAGKFLQTVKLIATLERGEDFKRALVMLRPIINWQLMRLPKQLKQKLKLWLMQQPAPSDKTGSGN